MKLRIAIFKSGRQASQQQTPTSPFSVMGFVQHCPHLESADIGGVQFEFDQNEQGIRVCELRFTKPQTAEFVQSICLVLGTTPIRLLDTTHTLAPTSRTIFALIGQRFGGGHLQSLKCTVDPIVATDAAMLLDLAPFHNLRSLSLAQCSNLTDEFLLQLPSLCPLITSLELLGGVQFTDAGMVTLLGKYRGNAMETICLNGCSRVGERTVRMAAQLFPRLSKLGVAGTTVTKEAMLLVVMFGMLRAACVI